MNLLEQLLKVNKASMTRQPSEQRREAILSTAIALFRTKGLLQTSTRDLTEALGISRSHIYHYFPNWQALCLAALEYYMQQDWQEARDELAEMEPEAALKRLTEWFLPDEVDPDWLIYADAWQIAARDEAYKALAQKVTVEWNGLIEQVITRGCETDVFRCKDVAQTARLLGGTINGYADMVSLEPSGHSRQQALADIDTLIKVLLQPT